MKYRSAGSIDTVAVVGSGVIGSGWTAAFLAKGLNVHVFDPGHGARDRLLVFVADALAQRRSAGRAASDPAPGALHFCDSLDEAVSGADFIQENTPERVDEKVALFGRLDALAAPDVLIGSSTSSLPISDLQVGCAHPQRCVLGHPFNPVHLMPLVEVGGGRATDAGAIDAAARFYASLGKECVRLQREIFGHIANRLTSAMFREAVSLVVSGYASVEDVDRAIRFGPALKWAVQGQFRTFELNGGAGGFEGFLAHFAPGIVRRWDSMVQPDLLDPELQRRLVEGIEAARRGQSIEFMTGRQDALLLRLLAVLEDTAPKPASGATER